MQGRVKGGRASLAITFRLSNQPDFQIEFVVDTGFNDYLTLPPQAISAMNRTAVFQYFGQTSRRDGNNVVNSLRYDRLGRNRNHSSHFSCGSKTINWYSFDGWPSSIDLFSGRWFCEFNGNILARNFRPG